MQCCLFKPTTPLELIFYFTLFYNLPIWIASMWFEFVSVGRCTSSLAPLCLIVATHTWNIFFGVKMEKSFHWQHIPHRRSTFIILYSIYRLDLQLPCCRLNLNLLYIELWLCYGATYFLFVQAPHYLPVVQNQCLLHCTGL